jgi:hypothetical protein
MSATGKLRDRLPAGDGLPLGQDNLRENRKSIVLGRA